MLPTPSFPGDSAATGTALQSPKAIALRQRDARLKAMKALVGSLAHSFNNSLAPLAGYTTLLGEEVKPGTASDQYLSKLNNALRKAESSIETILAATHPQRQFMPKLVDLAGLIQGNVDAWMKSVPASTQFAVECRVAPCKLCLDEAQWGQVIRHLLKNAEIALGSRGSLRLTLEERVLSESEASDLDLRTTQMFLLRVEDSGCGMSAEVLDRACEPLYSTRGMAPLAGLGLTLVHNVVQLHDGQLEIESTEQAGTTVRLWIPADRK